MIESTVTARGQTTLPKPVREALSVSPGDKVLYIIQEGEVRMTKARPIKRLFGITEIRRPPGELGRDGHCHSGGGSRIVLALDTNVLLRYLVQDDEAQAEAVSSLIESLTVDRPGFICREVIIEMVWVLERSYRFTRAQIADVLVEMTLTQGLVFESEDDVVRAALQYRQGGPGFADLMILAAVTRAQADPLHTFDRALSRKEGVALVEAASP